MVSVDAGGHIQFWDTLTWQPRFPMQVVDPPSVLIGIAFSPDSRTVAAGAFDGAIRLWDAGTGQPISEPIQAHTTGWALSVQFDPTGKLLASGGEDGIITLWDPATGAQMGPQLAGHANRVTDLAFSSDGKTLVSSSADGTVRFWNVEDGRPLGVPLTSGSQPLWGVETSSNAPQMYTTLDGFGTLAWWDAQGPLLLRPLLHAHLETEEMKMSADGSTFYLASIGPTALAIRPQQGNWAQNACAIANRSLSEEEWHKYMHGQEYDPVCK
jgi:WD40 repeat protein